MTEMDEDERRLCAKALAVEAYAVLGKTVTSDPERQAEGYARVAKLMARAAELTRAT